MQRLRNLARTWSWLLFAGCGLGLAALPAGADPIVYMRPLCLEIQAGQILTVHLSVGATGDSISCFYAVIGYDPVRLSIRDIDEGGLYRNSPHTTFPGSQFTAPDTFEVYNCVLGSGNFVLGPGDLADIEVEGLESGPAPLTIGFIDIRDVRRYPYPDLFVANCGTAAVGAGTSPVAPPAIVVRPNPAPGRATIELAGPAPAGPVYIYDLTGRLCRVLLGRGPSFIWDGLDHLGRPLAPGVYVVRGGERRTVNTKLLLVR